MNHISAVISQKVSIILAKPGDPINALDYSYVKNAEMQDKLTHTS
jgi:hypothetical protein